MWNWQQQPLNAPLDFLKVGHHGSINATPWGKTRGPQHEANQILDAILPLPQAGNAPDACAIVSSARKNYETIPASDLLVEIGKRVGNTCRYQQRLEAAGIDPKTLPLFEKFEAALLDEPQPLRTDIETMLTGRSFVRRGY